MQDERPRSALGGADLLICGALFAGVVAYLSGMPRNLGWADESFLLYEAKRIRDGQVMYRDFFEFVAPVAWYAIALLYAVFGTTFEAARTLTDVQHASIAALVYLCCRRLGVGRGLGVLAGLAHVTLCQPAWPYVSAHWFATVGTVLLLYLLLVGPWRTRPRWAIAPGLLGGLLIGIQQQKGVYLCAGAGAVLLADHLLARRERLGALVERLLCFAGSMLLVTLSIFGAAVASAGGENVYEALVRYPLVNYRRGYAYRWGEVTLITRSFAARTVPWVLKWLPLSLLLPLVEVAGGIARGRAGERIRDRIVLLVVALTAIVSIIYAPDFIHIAFIGAILFIALADSLEACLTALRGRFAVPARWILCSALAVACAVQLYAGLTSARAAFPYSYESAFGRVDISHPGQGKFIDEVRRRLDAIPGRELFCYRATTAMYLLAGGNNPTRFQLFKSRINDPAQAEEILSVLERKKLPYVISPAIRRVHDDPILNYLLDNYDVLPLKHPLLRLLRRKGFVEPD
jgi:hypothetical protein